MYICVTELYPPLGNKYFLKILVCKMKKEILKSRSLRWNFLYKIIYYTPYGTECRYTHLLVYRSIDEEILSLYVFLSVLFSCILRYFDDVFGTLFWSKNKCYWKLFASVHFFDRFPYNTLLKKLLYINNCTKWSAVSYLMVGHGRLQYFHLFFLKLASI